jgi:nucleoside-diphosphate-sugar epimerase
MKALVTGGTGFIGSRVVARLLAERHSVRLFSRSRAVPEELKGRDVEIVRGDLENPSTVIAAMEGMEVFYHLGEIRNTSKAAAERNVRLVEEILGNLTKAGVRRFVFVSSITVSGIPTAVPADEETKPGIVLNDHYTSYKRRCEELIAGATADFAILRPATTYGPGSRYLGKFIGMLDTIGPFGFPFVGNGRNLAPLIYVEDVAQAVYLSGVQPAASRQTFILTDSLRHTWFDFFIETAGALGKKVRIVPLPTLLLKLPAIPFSLFCDIFGFEFDLSGYTEFFSRDLYFDNAKARNLLGWQPQFSLADGVKEMVRSYRDQTILTPP